MYEMLWLMRRKSLRMAKGKSKVIKLAPGPYATHFQEYAHDRFFNAPMEKETYTQRPRVSLGDFLANRLGAALKELDKEDEI